MATYQELRKLFKDSDLLEKTEVAIIIAANNLIAVAPTAQDKAWAISVFKSPNVEAKKMLMAILASNSSFTTSQIKAVTDSVIQSKVDALVTVLVDAKAGQ